MAQAAVYPKPFMGPTAEQAEIPSPPQSPFDVGGARREGYSDDDILNHLTSTRKFDVAGALKEGYTKQDIIQHLATTPSNAKLAPGGGSFGATGASGSFAPYADLTPKKFNDTMYGLEYKVGQAAVDAVKGTAKTAYKAAFNPVEAIKATKNIAKGAVTGVTSTPANIQDLYEAAKRGDYEGITNSATKVLTENIPAVYGASEMLGGVGSLAEGPGAAAVDASRVRVYDKSVSNMGTVIRDGFKNMSGGQAATVYQPYVQSFLKRAGVDLNEILPESGPTSTLNRGGTVQALDKINDTLRNDWKASGRDPAKFKPYDDVHTAIADGAVNEAHAPIANAIYAARNVPANGVKVGINPQQQVIDALTDAKANLSPIERDAMGSTFDDAIEDVKQRGTTIGGLDDIKQDWNHKAGRLHKGTSAQQSEAQASAAMVYDIGATAIRSKLYPVLEQIVDRPGMTSTIRQAGIDESVAIRARNGIEINKIRNSNLADTAIGQSYIRYLKDGIPSVRGAVTAPVATGTSMLTRLSRENPMGQFNRAFKQGIGDMSATTIRNPAASLKNPELGLENPVVQGPSSTVPSPPLPNVGGPPNPIAPSAPLPAVAPTLENITQRQPLLPHEVEAQRLANSIPPSPPPSPIGTGLNTAIGPALEPQTPLTHPLMGGYSAITEQATPKPTEFAGNKPTVKPTRKATLNVARPLPPPDNHLGVKMTPQSGPNPPKGGPMPKSAADYFTAIAEDEAKAKKVDMKTGKEVTPETKKAAAPEKPSPELESLQAQRKKITAIKTDKWTSPATLDWIKGELANIDAQIAKLGEGKK